MACLDIVGFVMSHEQKKQTKKKNKKKKRLPPKQDIHKLLHIIVP